MQKAHQPIVLDWLENNTFAALEDTKKESIFQISICASAAGDGHLEALKSARAHGDPWEETALAAAQEGRLEVLQWAIANGCPWHQEAGHAAAARGHYNLLKWALANGAPYDPEELFESAAVYSQMVDKLEKEAFRMGYIPLLDQIAKSPRFQPSESLCELAASGGSLEALKWARLKGCDWGKTLSEAAREGHWDFVKEVHEMGCPIGNKNPLIYLAVQQGRLDILQWFYDNEHPINDFAISMAALNGDRKMSEWLLAHGCRMTSSTSANAAKGSHFELLQWLHSKGCPMESDTCANAAFNGRLDIVQWARQNGCPWDKTVFVEAASGGRIELLEWLKNEGAPYDLEELLSRSGILPYVKEWLRKNLSPQKII